MYIPDRLPHETSREYALRVITENIVSLELEPGSTVSENEISLELGLSRTPVREALIELAKTNIVEILPQRGSRIALIDYDMVDESRFIRLVFETAVAKICCEQAAQADIDALEANLRLQKFYLENEGHYDDFLRADNEFHRLLFAAAGKMQAYKLVNSLSVHFDRVRALSAGEHSENLSARNYENHRAILDAIENHDADLAEELLTAHLSRYKNDAEAIRAKYPQYFKPQN